MDSNEMLVGSINRVGRLIADAITPVEASPGTDKTGGSVSSLTEAVMGIANGLVAISKSVEHLADAITDVGDKLAK